jgi:6-phosphogluconolactonase (cycloisomerase 2 family)
MQNADKVWRLAKSEAGYTIAGHIPSPPGSGPRRVIASGKILYTLGETKNILTQQEIPDDPKETKVPFNVSISTLPPGINATYQHAAELLMPKPNDKFKAELLYISNRNVNTTMKHPGDSIAIFATKPLRLLSHVYTGLNQIRGMEFGGKDDRYLIAGGAAGGGVVVFERVAGGAYLRILARTMENDALNRTTFAWASRSSVSDSKDDFNLRRRNYQPRNLRRHIEG